MHVCVCVCVVFYLFMLRFKLLGSLGTKCEGWFEESFDGEFMALLKSAIQARRFGRDHSNMDLSSSVAAGSASTGGVLSERVPLRHGFSAPQLDGLAERLDEDDEDEDENGTLPSHAHQQPHAHLASLPTRVCAYSVTAAAVSEDVQDTQSELAWLNNEWFDINLSSQRAIAKVGSVDVFECMY